MPQPEKSFFLDLPDSFPGDAQESTDLLKGHWILVVQSKIEAEDLGLPFL